MNLSHLYYFKKLAEVQHFTRAAQELFIAQPTLSAAMSQLEKELGAPLFVKHTRAVKLTPYGQDFYRYVDLALQNLDTGISLVEQRAGLRRTTVRIGATYLVQDTAWEGYRRIPRWIMEGYLTMADEAADQLRGVVPTHVFLQAGVGSMAGAAAAYFANRYRKTPPAIIVVEPHAANCLFRTAEAADGKLHLVTGDMDSICAGLCCGEPCDIAWELLRDHAEFFASIPDEAAAMGMRILGNPLGSDPRVISGESGAAGLGLAAALLSDPALSEQKEMLGLNERSRILCFSTEGDTDRANYRGIVWKGKLPY
jgi:diaminopropionate ammonia-lyase